MVSDKTAGEEMKKIVELIERLEDGKEKSGLESMDMIDKTIKGVEEDIERLSYNTAIAKIMEFVNWYIDNVEKMNTQQRTRFFKTLSLILAPFAPYLAEQMWFELGNEGSVHDQSWPEYDPEKLKDDIVTLPIQVNGKLRAKIEVPTGLTKKEAKEMALNHEKVKDYIKEEPKRIIYVEDKIINFVI